MILQQFSVESPVVNKHTAYHSGSKYWYYLQNPIKMFFNFQAPLKIPVFLNILINILGSLQTHMIFFCQFKVISILTNLRWSILIFITQLHYLAIHIKMKSLNILQHGIYNLFEYTLI